ncbi:ABC transporter ATP-binding protein [Neobacillus rhizophilus]|uniref:ABC transporter ATP-binding protein n=1 Tax=Neobacillus rhizophilus TaxID=2833579 RepID=A0A942U5M4_9BACI|nr:ABC transporter ATP-binding protein [Neobacillus rhizophilus]MBS4215170.1 ABC transporter ATP-binding protein [Neobacillus rhizophilus]
MLELKQISAFYGNIQALDRISIQIPEGSIVTLLGANGAGKSSTLKVISQLLPIKSGTMVYKNEDISNLEPNEIVKRRIIHCPENRQVFPKLTVEENLIIGSYLRRDKDQIKKDLSDIFSYFPILKERLKQYASTLSGGEQQMLAIGRALMGNPKVLLLDEPSLGLAPIIVNQIFEIIQEINRKGTSILLVEQNANLALRIADYGYILENGRIGLEGRAEFLRNNDEISKYYLGGKSHAANLY